MQDSAKLARESDTALEDALVVAAQEVVAVRAEAEARTVALRDELNSALNTAEEVSQQARTQAAEAQEALGHCRAELAACRAELNTRPAERALEGLMGEQLTESRAQMRRLDLEAAEDRHALSEALDANAQLSAANGALATQVEALEERFSDVAGDIVDQRAQVANQVADRAEREQAHAAIAEELGQLREQLYGQQGHHGEALSELQSELSGLRGQLEELRGERDGLRGERDALQICADELSAGRLALAEKLAVAECALAELNEGQATLEEFADQESARSAELAQSLTDIKAERDGLSTRLEDQEARAKEQAGATAARQADNTSEQQAEVAKLKVELAEQRTASEALRAQVSEQRTEADGLRSEVTEQRTASAALQTQVAERQAEADELRSEVTEQRTASEALRAQVSEQRTEADGLRSEVTEQRTASEAMRAQVAELAALRGKLNVSQDGLAVSRSELMKSEAQLVTLRAELSASRAQVSSMGNQDTMPQRPPPPPSEVARLQAPRGMLGVFGGHGGAAGEDSARTVTRLPMVNDTAAKNNKEKLGQRSPAKGTSYSVTAVQEEVVFARASEKPRRRRD